PLWISSEISRTRPSPAGCLMIDLKMTKATPKPNTPSSGASVSIRMKSMSLSFLPYLGGIGVDPSEKPATQALHPGIHRAAPEPRPQVIGGKGWPLARGSRAESQTPALDLFGEGFRGVADRTGLPT